MVADKSSLFISISLVLDTFNVAMARKKNHFATLKKITTLQSPSHGLLLEIKKKSLREIFVDPTVSQTRDSVTSYNQPELCLVRLLKKCVIFTM